ncbi:MAG: choice-of-anchor D domain-containing protein [Burkholderiales bacterium]|nr:choice-of-anchor D domain-containing protein [Burkholderiales bacterium]
MLLPRSLCSVFSALLLGLLVTATSAQDLPADNDFFVIIQSHDAPSADSAKFLTYGWSGWAGKTIRWRYNDANRPTNLVATAATMIAQLQAAMNKWSAVCAVQFVYDGTTSTAPSLATSNRDGTNVIGWGALSGNTTGVTYSSASGPNASSLTIDESDMVINYQFNPVLAATLVHELGHMIGLRHSNVEQQVMSGPNTAPDPSTAYTGYSELQADDIAGCRALYGASASSGVPVATPSTTAMSFADTAVGFSSTQQILSLNNTGSAPLSIFAVVLAGDDFMLQSATCAPGDVVAVGGVCGVTLRFTPRSAGPRSGSLTITHSAGPGSSVIALSGVGTAGNAPATREMVEYRYAPLDYYFMTSRDSDKTVLDATSGWGRTGNNFLVYASQNGSTRGITRFYFDRVARSASRGSHFYTLLDSDVALLNAQNPGRSTAPGLPQNEGVDSYAWLPATVSSGSVCPAGQSPVYRLFRGATRFPDDPNHRFTTSVATYNAFMAQGWDGEGVSFCVPTN